MLRLRQLEAIEKRLQSQDNRGIKNPGRIARMQKKAEERDKILNQVSPKCGTDSGGLRVRQICIIICYNEKYTLYDRSSEITIVPFI